MRVRSNVALTALALSLVACAAPPISPELRTARDAYAAAKESVAADLAPAELDNARQALEKAEETFRKNHKSPEMLDDAYIAERAAQLALVVGLTEQERRAMMATATRMEKLEKKLATLTKEELAAAKSTLETQQRVLAEQQTKLNSMEGKLSAALASLKEAGNVKEESRGVVITLSGSVLFATGKDTLLPIAREKIGDVAKALKDQGYQNIIVEGHTDSRGSEVNNRTLSMQRAESVRSLLIESGLEASKISAVGVGESRPVADNNTPDGRANNRRVELVVTPE